MVGWSWWRRARDLRFRCELTPRRQQLSIKGDVEHMLVGGESLHVAMEAEEVVLWSSDDVAGCFHVFSLPHPRHRWMVQSKPMFVEDPRLGSPTVVVVS